MRQVLATLLCVVAVMAASTPWLGGVWADADFAAVILPVALPVAVAALFIATRRLAPAMLTTLIAALSVHIALNELGPPPLTETINRAPLTVVTHNVWVDNVDPEATIASLIKSNADILLLQETNGTIAPYLDRLRRAYPYGSVCRRRCSLAIFSRFPVDRVRYRFRDEHDEPYGPPLVQTIVRPGGGRPPFLIVSVHLSRSLSGQARRDEWLELAGALQRAGPDAAIVGGDFNLVGWSTGMATLEWGMKPMQRATHGDLSWPARVGAFVLPFGAAPIDHIFAGPQWQVAPSRRLMATGSDHFPVAVRLYWKGT